MNRFLDARALDRSFLVGTGLIILSLTVGLVVGLWRLSEQDARSEIAVTLSHLAEGVTRLDMAISAADRAPTLRERLAVASAYRVVLYHVDELRRADPETSALRARAGEIAPGASEDSPVWRAARLDALAARWLRDFAPPHRHDLGAVTMTPEMLALWRGDATRRGLEAAVAAILSATEGFAMRADGARSRPIDPLALKELLREDTATIVDLARDASALSAREKREASRLAEVALLVGCALGAIAAVANHALLLVPLRRRIIADADRLAAALEAAKAGDKAKSEFLSTMSHELRTPLNGVIGMASLLEATQLDARQRSFVETIHGSAEILLGVIEDILVFAKPDPEKLRPHDAPFALDALGAAPLERLTALAALKRLEVVVRRDFAGLTHLRGDLRKLDHVISNLLGNAVKFTDRGQIVLEIAARRSAEGRALLSITVRDTGRGVAPADAERIFGLFQQADQSATRSAGGAGLGLAVCATLLRLMDGRIGLHSEGLDKGAAFRVEVELPVALAVAASCETARPFSGRRALLVSPLADRREVGGDILRELGFACRAEPDEPGLWRALREAGATPPDLIVLDDIPPALAAESLRGKLRAASPLAGVAILLLRGPSAAAGPHAEDPLSEVLIKPPAPGAPEAAIRAVLARAEAARAVA